MLPMQHIDYNPAESSEQQFRSKQVKEMIQEMRPRKQMRISTTFTIALYISNPQCYEQV